MWVCVSIFLPFPVLTCVCVCILLVVSVSLFAPCFACLSPFRLAEVFVVCGAAVVYFCFVCLCCSVCVSGFLSLFPTCSPSPLLPGVFSLPIIILRSVWLSHLNLHKPPVSPFHSPHVPDPGRRTNVFFWHSRAGSSPGTGRCAGIFVRDASPCRRGPCVFVWRHTGCRSCAWRRPGVFVRDAGAGSRPSRWCYPRVFVRDGCTSASAGARGRPSVFVWDGRAGARPWCRPRVFVRDGCTGAGTGTWRCSSAGSCCSSVSG